MRIRKRHPLSFLSDPMVQLHNHPPPSDQPILPQDSSVLIGKEEQREKRVGDEETDQSRKKNLLLGAQIGSSSSHDQGKCSEVEEKVIPLKKRKGHLTEEEEDSKKAKSKMKKRFGYEEEKKRGGAIMEGSRCSRVNGRGWRCCQQTLVGYSLCEHHLGKGRLRSITNVKTRALGSSTPVNPPPPPPPLPLPCISNDEKKPLVVSKKRMKLGMVKARSLSSLLGQTKNEITLPEK